MARFQNKKKVAFVRPIAKKQQLQSVDHVTGDKIPRSFAFSSCKLPSSLRQLQSELRKLMLHFTALSLKADSPLHFRLEKNGNNLRDFLNVAGPMGVTHFLMLSKTGTSPYLRVSRTPQGPTLTFKINEYLLAVDNLDPSCVRVVLRIFSKTHPR